MPHFSEVIFLLQTFVFLYGGARRHALFLLEYSIHARQ